MIFLLLMIRYCFCTSARIQSNLISRGLCSASILEPIPTNSNVYECKKLDYPLLKVNFKQVDSDIIWNVLCNLNLTLKDWLLHKHFNVWLSPSWQSLSSNNTSINLCWFAVLCFFLLNENCLIKDGQDKIMPLQKCWE